MSKIIKIISTVFTVTALLAVLLFAFISVSPTKLLKIHFVASGSMEPAIKTGSIVIVVKTDPGKINKNDIINFSRTLGTDDTTTHRVVDILIKDGMVKFITKGDANQTPDVDQIEANNIVGKVFFTIPYLGYFYAWTKTPAGFAISIILPAIYIIISEIIKIKKVIEEEAIKKYQKSQKPKSGGSIFPVILFIFSLFATSSATNTHSYFSSALIIDNNVFATGNWQEDTIPPTTFITSNTYAFSSNQINITYTFNDDNPDHIELCHSYNLGDWSCQDVGLTSPFVFTANQAGGVYCFATIGHDTAGNVELKTLPNPPQINPLDPLLYCTNYISP